MSNIHRVWNRAQSTFSSSLLLESVSHNTLQLQYTSVIAWMTVDKKSSGMVLRSDRGRGGQRLILISASRPEYKRPKHFRRLIFSTCFFRAGFSLWYKLLETNVACLLTTLSSHNTMLLLSRIYCVSSVSNQTHTHMPRDTADYAFVIFTCEVEDLTHTNSVHA